MGEKEAFFCRQVAKACDLPEDKFDEETEVHVLPMEEERHQVDGGVEGEEGGEKEEGEASTGGQQEANLGSSDYTSNGSIDYTSNSVGQLGNNSAEADADSAKCFMPSRGLEVHPGAGPYTSAFSRSTSVLTRATLGYEVG